MHKHWTGDEAGARKSIRKDLGYMDIYERRNLHDLHDAKEMLTARVEALEAENKRLRAEIQAAKDRNTSTCEGCGAFIDTRYCARCCRLWESGKDMG